MNLGAGDMNSFVESGGLVVEVTVSCIWNDEGTFAGRGSSLSGIDRKPVREPHVQSPGGQRERDACEEVKESRTDTLMHRRTRGRCARP